MVNGKNNLGLGTHARQTFMPVMLLEIDPLFSREFPFGSAQPSPSVFAQSPSHLGITLLVFPYGLPEPLGVLCAPVEVMPSMFLPMAAVVFSPLLFILFPVCVVTPEGRRPHPFGITRAAFTGKFVRAVFAGPVILFDAPLTSRADPRLSAPIAGKLVEVSNFMAAAADGGAHRGRVDI